jgi:hypothetical protein
MSGFVANELSAFCGGRFADHRGALAELSGSLFELLFCQLSLRVIDGEPARAVK